MTLYAPKSFRDPRRSPKALLARLLADDPRCAICKMDLVALAARRYAALHALESAMREAISRGVPRQDVRAWHPTCTANPVFVVLREMGFKRPMGSLAELDHVRPLWAGGVDEPSNARPLCSPCHHEVTRLQARQRASAKRRAERKGVA